MVWGSALGPGTEAGPKPSRLVRQRREVQRLETLLPRLWGGPAAPCPRPAGVKAPHSSGWAPHAADSSLDCFLGPAFPGRHWGPGQPQQ